MTVKLFFEDLTPGMAAKLVTRYRCRDDSTKHAAKPAVNSSVTPLAREPLGHLDMELVTPAGKK